MQRVAARGSGQVLYANFLWLGIRRYFIWCGNILSVSETRELIGLVETDEDLANLSSDSNPQQYCHLLCQHRELIGPIVRYQDLINLTSMTHPKQIERYLSLDLAASDIRAYNEFNSHFRVF